MLEIRRILCPIDFSDFLRRALDRDQLLADTKAFIETEAARGVAMDAMVREGNTTAEILDQASCMNADLIVHLDRQHSTSFARPPVRRLRSAASDP